MVDFQSRDTRRTLGDEEHDGKEAEEEDEREEEAEAADAAAKTEGEETTAGSESGTADRAETASEAAGGATAEGTAADPLDAAGTGETTAGGDAVEGGEQEAAADIAMPEGMAYAVLTVEAATGADAATDPADTAVAALDGEATVATRGTVEPSYDAVQSTVADLVERRDVSAVLTLGGVGVGPADVTREAVEPLFDKSLPGFGELYRAMSHEQEGTAVMRTRVTAGLVGPVPVFCLPGDPAGARRAIDRLVRAEAASLVAEARTDSP